MTGKKKSNEDRRERDLVLIIDDVPTNLSILENILKENNYEIAIAKSGQEGLELARKLQPGIILLDIIMPDFDGFLVCKALKKSSLTMDIPVIFLTVKTEIENILKGFEMGAVDYITKPFYPVEILARVKTHLQLRKAQLDIVELERKNAVFALMVTASHELSQPLTVLQGNFEMFRGAVKNQQYPEAQQKQLRKMGEALVKLDRILERFRNSANIRFREYGDGKEMVEMGDDMDDSS